VPWVWDAEQRWSYDTVVEAVVATLDAQEVERAALVGHSMGGAVALGVAAAAPDRTSALVLVDALALSPGRRRMARLGLQGRHLRTFATLATARDFVGWAARRPRDVVATALSIGEELAEALDTPLRVASGRSPEERVEHDWVYRHPTFFAHQLDAALAGVGAA
jgi:pimeloyl-ACP methyl ester carboxylesterase